jgi:hypothetical protein
MPLTLMGRGLYLMVPLVVLLLYMLVLMMVGWWLMFLL